MANQHVAPFHAYQQLNDELDRGKKHTEANCHRALPGHPRIFLDSRQYLLEFLIRDLCPVELEKISGSLWWMSKQDSANISPLHQQRVKGRTIIVAEDPKLHLTWMDNRIYIKPLPAYITSHHFWTHYLGDTQDEKAGTPETVLRIRKSARGFLRTYFFLITHESDFRIAKEPGLSLIPQDVTWKQFCEFSSGFEHILDNEVTGRYGYGEIRLARLNFYAPLLLYRSHYYRVYREYGDYFENLIGPWFFVFGFTTVILSGLQVAVGVEQLSRGEEAAIGKSWIHSSFVLSMFTVICIFLLVTWLVFLYTFKVAKEWQYALKERFRRRKSQNPDER